MSTYLAGSLVTVATYSGSVASPAGGFRNADGVLADPMVVVLRYRAAGQPLVTVTYPDARIVRDGTGLYRANLDTTGSPAGQWSYEWIGTGLIQAAAEGAFEVTAAFT